MSKSHAHTRRPYTALTKVVLTGLVLATLAYASEFLFLGFDREIGIVVGCLTVASVLVATGWRWTPVVGALVAGGILLGNPWLQINLSRPPTSGFFLAAAAQVAFSLIAVGVGLGAAVQNY